MPTALDLENEFVGERLMIFLTELLIALREIIPRMDLQILKGRDELVCVLTTPEAGFLDADPKKVHGLVARLDKAVGRDPLRHVLLYQLGDLGEPLPVVRRIEGALEHGHIAVDADEPFDLGAEACQIRGHGKPTDAGLQAFQTNKNNEQFNTVLAALENDVSPWLRNSLYSRTKDAYDVYNQPDVRNANTSGGGFLEYAKKLGLY